MEAAGNETPEDDSSLSHSGIDSDDLTKSMDSPWKPTAKEMMKIDAQKTTAQQNVKILTDSPLRSPASKVLENLRNAENKMAFLENFYLENCQKLEAYNQFWKELLYTLAINGVPGINVNTEYSPSVVIGLLNYYVEELKTRFKKYQLEIGELSVKSKEMFSSAEIVAKIEQHKKNVFALIETYEKELDAVREENLQLKENQCHLESEMDYLQMKNVYLERGTMYQGQLEESFFEGELDKDKIMAELECRSAASERLNSTLRNELNNSQSMALYAQKRLEVLMKKLSTIEEESMSQLAEVSQKAEISAALENALITTLSEKGSGVDKPEASPEECQKIIDEWNRLMKESITKNEQTVVEIETESKAAKEKVVEKENELQEIRKKSEEIDHEINVLGESYRLKKEEAKQLAESINVLSTQFEIASKYNQELRLLYEEKRKHYNAAMDKTFADSSGLSGSEDQHDRSGLSDDSVFIHSPAPEKSKMFFPGIAGSSQTPHSPLTTGGTTTPYDVAPILCSPTRARGTPGISVPLRPRTPSPKTPWISSSRFGYTNPRAVKLNLPPLKCFQYEPAKKPVSSSPKKISPIEAPLASSPMKSGDENVRYYPKDHVGRYVQYIPTYGTPPITKSVDRKPHGIFTPRGVFERKHVAIRNLFGSDYESPGSPWGTGKKFHYDTDEYYPEVFNNSFESDLNQSIEWQAQSFEDYPPVINRPMSPQTPDSPYVQQRHHSSRSNTPYSPRGVIDRSFSPASDSPYSPQAIINRPYSPESGSPFSPQGIIDRSYSLSSGSPYSPGAIVNRTYAPESASPLSPQAVINRPFSPSSASPSSPVAIINRPYSPQSVSPSSPQDMINVFFSPRRQNTLSSRGSYATAASSSPIRTWRSNYS